MPDFASVQATPRTALTQIGGWKLGRTLGRGAYAHVRLATHSNGHQAACKILPALHSDPSRKVSWDETVDAVEAHKEIVFLKALCGAGLKGIVGLEGVMEEGGWTYVFLTLYPHSASNLPTPWPKEQFIPFFRQLLHIVHALHTLNVSHEDIKRSNVLVDRLGWPILVDFGFSHFKAGGGLVRSAGGTLDYSSPEKTADLLYDPKASDVWALGILMTKLLGIQHPYCHDHNEDTSSTVRRRILAGDALFEWKREHQGRGGLAELVMGMLERVPEARWTIPQILKHQWLAPAHPDPEPFIPPPFDLPINMPKTPAGVVQDLCFLSYLEGEFQLCETPRKIHQHLAGTEQCWEKRWAGMLGAWSKRAEMDWEDIPSIITPIKPRIRVHPSKSLDLLRPIKNGALKEIHLSPNTAINTPQVGTLATVTEVQEKENAPPKLERKSRMYGMKSREESQKTFSDVKGAAGIEPKAKARTHTKNRSTKPKSKIPVLVVAKTSQTVVSNSPSPKSAIVEHGRTRKTAVKAQNAPHNLNKVKQTTQSSDVAANVSKPSEENTVPAPKAGPIERKKTGNTLNRKGVAKEAQKQESSPATTSQESANFNVGKAAGKNARVAQRSNSDDKAVPPDRQLRSLLLSKPTVEEPRRRSPRLQEQ